MKKQIVKWIHRAGYDLVKKPADPLREYRHEPEFCALHVLCSPYTMTSIERMYALYQSVRYVLANDIPGSFVECGVWRGGSAMLMAKMLADRGIRDRKLYLYDTFEGMSPPTTQDVDFRGRKADGLLEKHADQKETSVWCLADLNEVKHNMGKTGWAESNIVYVEGKVEDTIPSRLPEAPIALLRLDTDWYESTYHELLHLYPLLVKNGFLIIDDYGYWKGAREAVDKYFEENRIKIFMNRLDISARAGIKI